MMRINLVGRAQPGSSKLKISNTYTRLILNPPNTVGRTPFKRDRIFPNSFFRSCEGQLPSPTGDSLEQALFVQTNIDIDITVFSQVGNGKLGQKLSSRVVQNEVKHIERKHLQA